MALSEHTAAVLHSYTPPSGTEAKRIEWRRQDVARYGLTLAEYEALLAAQGGVCAICEEPCASGRRLAVDHDHSCCPGRKSCGKCIRGLLCLACNQSIGKFKDDPALLRRAADYLERN